MINVLLEKADKVVIGGGMAFTFLKARGLSTGGSLVAHDPLLTLALTLTLTLTLTQP